MALAAFPGSFIPTSIHRGVHDMVALSGGTVLVRKLGEISENLSKATSVAVGFPVSAEAENPDALRYPNGTMVAAVAAFQEFGAPRAAIPPRPFMRPTIAKHKGEWGDNLIGLLMSSNYDSELALETMGSLVVSQIQEQIGEVTTPKLKPITMLLRKWRREGRVINRSVVEEARAAIEAGDQSWQNESPKPLEDTFQMKLAVQKVVK